jgi:radical SAM protein with 4Fe4S-binding SPASM domain
MTGNGFVRKVSDATFDPLRGKSPILRELDIELTERCNNRCIHCYINLPEDDPEAAAREMDTEFVIDLLTQAANLGCLSVRFTGGEPLLRDDFVEIYLAARRLGMRVLIFTNARRITPEIADHFSRVPPGLPIEVSVYGMRPNSYDSVTGVRGAYEEFRRGIELLFEYRIPFIVKSVLLPIFREELAEFMVWTSDIPGMDGQPSITTQLDCRARRDDAEKNRRICELRLDPEEVVAHDFQHPGYLKEMRQFCGSFLCPATDQLFTCGAGRELCIDSYGFAQMCFLLRHPDTVVNLRDASIKQVMTEYFPKFREARGENQEYLRQCASCFIKGLCDQCPAKSWMEHGTLDTPVEYLCKIGHARARHLGIIGEHERTWEITDGKERIAKFLSADPSLFEA